MPAPHPSRQGPRPSYSELLKRVHVTINDKDTTVSLDLALYEHLKTQLAREGTTVKHWAQARIDAMVAEYPGGKIDRRTNCLSRRLRVQALQLMAQRLDALEAEFELIHAMGEKPKTRRKAKSVASDPAAAKTPETQAMNARQLLSKKPKTAEPVVGADADAEIEAAQAT